MAMLYAHLLIIEELEREHQRNETRLFRRMVRDAQNPFTFSDTEFRKQFRLNKEACMDLITTLIPYMNVGVYRSRIPVMLRVLSALHFFAVGSYQRSVGGNMLACLSQTMVCRSIHEVSNAIVRHLLRRWVQFPKNENRKNDVKERFQRRHRMPNIIGVVDGTHIAIVKPRENENVYVNRKGYHSLNCQIICDSNLRIINIVARWPGSTHDAFMWRASLIGQTMRVNYENGDHDSKVMGDSGYPCLPWLLVPLAHPATAREARFNDTFKRCRSVVERCIGLLKGRFRCLLKDRTLHYSPRMAARIVMACAVLHNIAIHYRIENPPLIWDEIDIELVQPQGPPRQDIEYRQMGQEVRNRYIEQYF